MEKDGIQVQVYRTNSRGERELSIYTLPADIRLVIVDADRLHGDVSGYYDIDPGKAGSQIDGVLKWRGDGTLLGR